MPKLLHKIALAWMLVWLPLSGVMASTLPFCGKGIGGWVAMQRTQVMAASDSAQALPPCHMMEDSNDADVQSTQADSAPAPERSSVPGEHCSLCHLAGAIALPVMPYLPQIAGSTPLAVPFESHFHSWLGEPLQPPPLSSPA